MLQQAFAVVRYCISEPPPAAVTGSDIKFEAESNNLSTPLPSMIVPDVQDYATVSTFSTVVCEPIATTEIKRERRFIFHDTTIQL